MEETLNVYVGTVSSVDAEPGDYTLATIKTIQDCAIFAPSIKEAEMLIPEETYLQRLILTKDWILINREPRVGQYYLVEAKYRNERYIGEITYETITYLIQSETFAELEEIVMEHSGEDFQYIQMIDKFPYEVFRA